MKNRGVHNLTKPLGLIVLVVFLVLMPLFAKGYWLHILVLFVINVILVVSFRMITTMGGWSFAHIVIMGIGGYTTALSTTKFLHWSFWVTLPLGGLAGALFALIISYPCLRTKGFYFFLSTFAAGEAMRQAWIRWNTIFEGVLGIAFIPRPDSILGIHFEGEVPCYYLILSICLFSLTIMYRLDKSRIGDTVKATHSSEELCESVGINTGAYKTQIFVLGSFFSAIAGVLFAHYEGLVCPQDFTVLYAYSICVVPAIVGGTRTFAGPIVGLAVMTGIVEIFRDFLQWVPLIDGVIIITILMFLPGGLEDVPKRISPLVRKIRVIAKE